jgi:tape measure domain-containing protein
VTAPVVRSDATGTLAGVAGESSVLVRLRLLGQQAFSAGTGRAAASLQGLEHAGAAAGTALGATGRALRLVGIAAGGAAAAAVVAGAKYDAVQDSQRVAFTTFLGSAEKARAFIVQLQDLAQRSPVLDPKTTGEGARALLAYGLSAKQTLPFVEALGDMSAASGRSIQEVLPNAARAIGQIASKGKLQTEELNQLAESVGLNRNKIAEALHMTREDFAATFTPGNNLDAAKALPAVLEAMRKQSAGAANRLAKTTAGRFDRLKEMMSRRAGEAIRPFYDLAGQAFGRLADGLTHVDTASIGRTVRDKVAGIMAGVSGGGATGGVMTGDFGAQQLGGKLRGAFDSALGFISGLVPKVGAVVGQVLDALKPAAPFLQNVLLPLLGGVAVGVIGGVVAAFKVAVPVVRILATVLGWLGQQARPIRPVIAGVGVVLGVVFGPGILGRAIGLLGRLVAVLGPRLGFVTRLAAVALQAMRLPLLIVRVAFGAVTRTVGVFFRVLLRAGSAAVSFAARLIGGVGRAIGAARRLVSGVTGAVRELPLHVAAIGGRVIGQLTGRIARGLPRVASSARSIGLAIVRGIAHAIRSAPGAVADALMSIVPDPVKSAVGGLIGLVRGRQGGGVVGVGETTLVGESGPELARFPAGTRIVPAGQTAQLMAQPSATRTPAPLASGARPILIQFQPLLDGRVLHSSVHRVERDTLEAR